MSSKENFYDMVKVSGGLVTVTRPSTSESTVANLGGTGTTREYQVSGDTSQDGEDGVMSIYDFQGSSLVSPQKGDRITDGDEVFAITYVRKMYGIGRELYGWRIRMIG